MPLNALVVMSGFPNKERERERDRKRERETERERLREKVTPRQLSW